MSDQEIKEKAIRLIWETNETLPFAYANHIYVSHAGEKEFHIFFGHVAPPLTIGLTEEELPDSVSITPVAKIIVTPEVMSDFLDVLNKNFRSFAEKESASKENIND